jgi:serine protease Do
LRVGDVIVSVDGKPIQDPHAFRYRLVTKGIGSSADLRLVRKGRTLTATLSLVAPVEDPPRDARSLSGRHPLAGSKVANLSPAVAEEIGMDVERQGVVVLEVRSNTPAARIGVRRGDIIVGVNNAKVGSVETLVIVLERSIGGWRLSVERAGRVFNLAIAG